MKRLIDGLQNKLLDLLINWFNKEFPAQQPIRVPVRIKKPWDNNRRTK